jgi:2-polyprenyl-6-methoxyphenol hydroxylase-like FAD-dependent oxidoreductase
VVLGGSIAGLLAARVLADHASTVLIVERDEPDTGERRRALAVNRLARGRRRRRTAPAPTSVANSAAIPR